MGGTGLAAGHEGYHGPQDHGFGAAGQVLVVAGGAPALADPGEGPLDDPAAREHFEGAGRACGYLTDHKHGPVGEVDHLVRRAAEDQPGQVASSS